MSTPILGPSCNRKILDDGTKVLLHIQNRYLFFPPGSPLVLPPHLFLPRNLAPRTENEGTADMRPPRRPIHAVSAWVRRQPPKVKAFLAVVSGMAALVLLRVVVHDHDNLFVAAEAVHSIGICVLIYKLTKEKTCAGN